MEQAGSSKEDLTLDRVKELTWLTRSESATYLRVHARTVDRWADEGRITRYKVEGIQSVRFKREELDALMVPESGPGEWAAADSAQGLPMGNVASRAGGAPDDPFGE